MQLKRNKKTERNKEIYELRKAGAYYHQIAERFNISICRVRQIIEVEEDKNGCKRVDSNSGEK